MPRTEVDVNRLILSLSLSSTFPPSHSALYSSATLSLHFSIFSVILYSYPINYLNQSSLALFFYTYPKHLNRFLSILSSPLNSHPQLSPISEFHTLSTLLTPHMFLKHIISNTSIFLLSCALNDHVSQPYTAVGIKRFHITPILLLWISCSLSTTLPSSPNLSSLENFMRHFLPHTTIHTYHCS